MTKDVLLVLTENWADWEAANAIAEINSVPQYTVKTIALDNQSKASIGGIRAEIDYTFADCPSLATVAMVVLPGGFSWKDHDYPEIAHFLKMTKQEKIPIAAICGATQFLGKHGLLDGIKHTGDSLDYFTAFDSYHAKETFVEDQLVNDGGIITANETAALEFALEIFNVLKIAEPSELEIWYKNFKYGFIKQNNLKQTKISG